MVSTKVHLLYFVCDAARREGLSVDEVVKLFSKDIVKQAYKILDDVDIKNKAGDK